MVLATVSIFSDSQRKNFDQARNWGSKGLKLRKVAARVRFYLQIRKSLLTGSAARNGRCKQWWCEWPVEEAVCAEKAAAARSWALSGGPMAARALGLQQGHMGRSGFQKAGTGPEQALLLQDLTQQDWMRSHRTVTFLKEYLLLIFFNF